MGQQYLRSSDCLDSK